MRKSLERVRQGGETGSSTGETTWQEASKDRTIVQLRMRSANWS